MACIVIALGGNALLTRGQSPRMTTQRANARVAARAIAALAPGNRIVVTHGNGPQVGLLALQAAAHDPDVPVPLDVLGAESEGMIGYLLEQELRAALPEGTEVATLLTLVEVDAADPGFAAPSKFIGPVYTRAEAERLAAAEGWTVRPDGTAWRRVVASPMPRRILQLGPIGWLLERGAVVIAAGGGGIPVTRGGDGRLTGVEAVIDKDHCSALLACALEADALLLATDVAAVFRDWGTPGARPIAAARADEFDGHDLPAGSMGPKVDAACAFARQRRRAAVIGALADLPAMLRGEAGTRILPPDYDTQ
jgi:carbamate kinase